MRKLYDFKSFFCSQGFYVCKIAHAALRWCQKSGSIVKFKNTCSLYEFLNLNLQIFCKSIKGDERRIAFSSLKKGNVGSVKPDIKRHSFLADTSFKSDFPQLLTEFYQDMFKIFIGFGLLKFHGNCTKYTCILIPMCLSVYRLRVSYKKLVIA